MCRHALYQDHARHVDRKLFENTSRFAGNLLTDLSRSTVVVFLLTLFAVLLWRETINHRKHNQSFRLLNMFDHKVRLLSSAILLSSWLSPQVRAAAAPAQHAAGLQFTPVEDQMDHLAHFTQADSVEDAKSVMQDLHTSYAAAINDHLGDGCTEENMIVRKEWWVMNAI